jgi:hypothetical protein
MGAQRPLWEWLLPGLICLSPMGAIAYYCASAGEEAPLPEAPAAKRLARVSDPVGRAGGIRLIRL